MSSVSNGDDPPSLSITELNNCNIKHLRAARGAGVLPLCNPKKKKEGKKGGVRLPAKVDLFGDIIMEAVWLF